jgi:NAD(P)-dependent dehydrogenase (short-subunit alcohol dehydrogenase family)
MAMSKPVVTLILSLQHELTSKGIRVQVVLPGRTATDGWDVAGFPWQKMPPEIVMPVEDMVDAALIGLDQGKLVTIPGLHNGDEWTRFEAIRRGMLPQFGTSVPAPRYRNQARRSGSHAQSFAERVRSNQRGLESARREYNAGLSSARARAQ